MLILQEPSTMVDLMGVGVFVTDADGRCVYANGAFLRNAGIELQQALGDGWAAGIHDEGGHAIVAAWRRAFEEGREVDHTYRRRAPTGNEVWSRVTARQLTDADGRICGYVGTVLDVTERESLLEEIGASNERLAMAVEGARLGVWDWDLESNRFAYSERWATMMGYAPDELPHKYSVWKDRVHPDDVREVRAAILSHLRNRISMFRSEHRMRCRDGHYTWVLATGRVVERSPTGRALRIAGITMDISIEREIAQVLAEREAQLRKVVDHLHELNDQLVFAADHDGLTELLNHRAFRREADFRIQSRRGHESVGLLLIDLDHFKQINDRFGHATGDEVLKGFAGLLRSLFPPGTLIGRLGGEEFAVLLFTAGHEALREAGERIVMSCRLRTWPIEAVRCSVGAALESERPAVEGMLAAADRNLYAAKRRGRDQVWLDRAA